MRRQSDIVLAYNGNGARIHTDTDTHTNPRVRGKTLPTTGKLIHLPLNVMPCMTHTQTHLTSSIVCHLTLTHGINAQRSIRDMRSRE